ncbi:PCMD domain-containing protein [Fibrobacter sp. UWEL]|uniref:PCMD domain-containing protein n=1 Tax=Fibrobacter sp. UWEL TaxID=1896209 RepID=UPI00090F4891|nr:PCMD domain-containing protein [Fibrobacter sp. UWEL]SHK67926.1 Putative carbohydrate metabolism domain-containing protein [Fibrobacter sp. UWEL]
MKNILKFFLFAFVVLMFAACTADYDTFCKSHYKAFNSISFDEQDGDPSVYPEEHLIKATLIAPPESLSTWDSVTIDSYDISTMASIHLVDGKFKEFPKDSAALDSLANEVSYVKDKLHKGDRIRIPKGLIVYIMVVAENGDPSIWKIEFEIPGVEVASSSSSAEADDGDDEAEMSSSSKEPESSSSSVALLSGKDLLQVTFENQLKSNRGDDSVFVKLNSDADLSKAELKDIVISEGATIDPDPKKVESWEKPQAFKVTAEDGSIKNWVIVVSVAEADETASDEKELLSAKVADAEVKIDHDKKTLTVDFDSKQAATEAVVELTVSETASHDLTTDKIDLTSEKTFTITAEDGSSEQWTIVASYPMPTESPRILALKIADKDAVVDSVEENGKMVYWAHYDDLEFRSDLSALKVSDIKLSDGAEITGVKDGSSYDLGTGVKVSVSNGGESVDYEIRAGYQLPGSDFNTWSSNDVKPDSVWGNANTILTTTSKYSSNGVIGAQIKTGSAVGKIASGSLYTAEFNPKGVGTLAMASSSTWPDGNELLDFGKKFGARPAYMDVTFSYNGSGDSCDVYIVLENRTGDKNQNRSSSDVNKLVASAWYRSTTDNNSGRKNPDVVSVSEKNSAGLRTIRLKLKYGTPLEGSPIENSSVFTTTLSSKDSKAINNGVIQGTGNETVTHIRVVFASSADGNHYNGKSGATLIVDEVRLIY